MEQVRFTPPKFNMEPEDHGFQKDFPFPGTFFRFHVKFRGCIFLLWVVMFGGQQPSKRKCHGNRSEKTYFTFAPTFHTKEVLRDTNSLWKFSTFSTMVFQPPKEFSKHWNDRNTKISSPLTHRTCGLERNKNTHSCGGTWWMHLVHQPVDKTLSCIRLIMKTDILDKHIVVIKVPWGLQLNLQFLSKHSFTALGSLEVFGMSRLSTSC